MKIRRLTLTITIIQLSEEMMIMLTSFLLWALSGDTSGENIKTHI